MAVIPRRHRNNLLKVLLLVPAAWLLASLLLPDTGTAQPQQSEKRVRVKRPAEQPQEPDSPAEENNEKHELEEEQEEEDDDVGDDDEEEAKKEEKEENKVIVPPVDPNAPGEMGKPVKFDNPDPETKKLIDKGWKDNAYNQHASDLISVHRSLPDHRHEWCRAEGRNLPVSRLPAASVIICFHNEGWSALLRTVHSVINRSPPALLAEVVLVDDASTQDHLQDRLEQYVAALGPKVKIVRSPERVGLIRARLLGAARATGPVLTYLDSHCECTEGWLEPLLDRIARNKTNVVCPIIDIISDDTLAYQRSSYLAVGGFDWNLVFNWHGVPEREKKRRSHQAEPAHSPTMAGGLFAIDKEFFERLGSYDSGFDIWGGENLELSFKTWLVVCTIITYKFYKFLFGRMCGGTLEIVPCSHVGHIFRKRSPYKWRSGVNVLRRNSIRLAEVWLDEYKQYYYDRIGGDLGSYGDVSSRHKLRKDLQCKSFKVTALLCFNC